MSNSPEDPLVSYVIATYNRPDDLADAIDSVLAQEYRPLEIVVISNSTDETSTMFEPGERFDHEFVHYHEFEGRMGVPEARNVGYEYASGDILVTIDDDAVLPDSDATDVIVSRFDEHDDVGALAFQSRYDETGEPIRMEIPDPPDFELTPEDEYRTTSFIGVGNALRRSALEAAGAYPSDFVYGFEEMDLSVRLLDARYDILYVPSIVVLHKQSPEGRRPDLEALERQVENRMRLTVRNLPWRYVVFSALLWSTYGFVRTGFRPSSIARILRRIYEDRYELLAQRDVVDGGTIRSIKSRESMLFLWWYGPNPRRLIGEHGDLERFGW